MNTYLNKVKLYVIIFAVLVVGVSTLIAKVLRQNVYITPSYAMRTLSAARIKNEFAATQRSATSTLSSFSVDFAQSVPVLVYHGILKDTGSEDADQGSEGSGILLKNFKDHMFALKRAGYSTISSSDLRTYLQTGKSLPEKAILITFDDGRIDSFKHADPILNALDYMATMFVIGKFGLNEWDQRYYLSSKHIKEMSRNGRWDIQAHSFDGHNSYLTSPSVKDGHFFSHKFWLADNRLETDEEFAKRIAADLSKIKTELESLIKKPIIGFAYPFGDFGQNNTNYANARSVNIAEAADIYDLVFFQNDPNYRYTHNYYVPEHANDDVFVVKRININQSWSGNELIAAIEKGTAKTLPYTDNFNEDNGWRVYWGDMEIEPGNLHIRTKENETGATIILDGTRKWKNYSLRSEVSSPNGSSVFIWTRYQNDLHNAACNFGNGFIHIEQSINGQKRVIKGEVSPDIRLPDGDFVVEAQVKDRTIRCILNDSRVVEGQFLDVSIPDGGIGFKTWSEMPGLARLNIKSVIVQEI